MVKRDPAYGGWFTIQDLGSPGSRHDFNVRGFDRHGNLLMHTWHISKSSMQMECDVWRSRGAVERPFNYRMPQNQSHKPPSKTPAPTPTTRGVPLPRLRQ